MFQEPAADTDHYFTIFLNQCKVLSKKDIHFPPAAHNQPLGPSQMLTQTYVRPHASAQRWSKVKLAPFLFAFDLFPELVHHTAVSAECIYVNVLVWITSAFLNQVSRSFQLTML